MARSKPMALKIPTSLLRPHEAELSNGLRIRLLPDPEVSVISYQTVFRVGSRNEVQGLTGISHLFEHLMFNGAKRYGPTEFDRLIESRGGGSNAYTSNDLTVYHEEAPADALDLLIDLEADRMSGLALTEASLASEREVVKEERRLRVDDSVMGQVDEQLQALVFLAHPYHWPIIGWPADLDRISLADCEAFFARHYAPGNATLYLTGRFEPDAVLPILERAYAGLPRGPGVHEVALGEVPQRGERRAIVRHPAQVPALAMGFRAPSGAGRFAPELDALQALLSFGEGSLLVRDLVFDRQLCTGVEADFGWRLDPGVFVIAAELPPRGEPERVEEEIWRRLAGLASRGPNPAHLARAKSQMEVALVRELASCAGRGHAVGEAEHLLGDPLAAGRLFQRIRGVTPHSVQLAAAETFRRDQVCVVTVEPTAGVEGRRSKPRAKPKVRPR